MHRIFLDFSCDDRVFQSLAEPLPVSDRKLLEAEPSVVKKLRRYFVSKGWESEFGPEADDIFDRMAHQLPDSDLSSFIRNTRFTMTRKAPMAEATFGYYGDADFGILRIRFRAGTEAVLVDLARRMATGLINEVPELSLNTMEVFEAGQDVPLLSGGEVAIVPEPLHFFSVENLTIWLPFVVSTVFLVFGTSFQLLQLGDPGGADMFDGAFGAWYGRLLGPTAMAIVTTLSAFVAKRGMQEDERRSAEWDLQSTAGG